MSYIKQGFTKNQVLEANHLNYIEKGIEAANCDPDTLFKPTVEMGSFALADGEWAPIYYGSLTYRVGKFLRPYSNTISITVNTDCLVAAFQYNNEFRFISRKDYVNVSKDVSTNISLDTLLNILSFEVVFVKTPIISSS